MCVSNRRPPFSLLSSSLRKGPNPSNPETRLRERERERVVGRSGKTVSTKGKGKEQIGMGYMECMTASIGSIVDVYLYSSSRCILYGYMYR